MFRTIVRRYATQFTIYRYGSFLGDRGFVSGAEVVTAERGVMGGQLSATQAASTLPDVAREKRAPPRISTRILG